MSPPHTLTPSQENYLEHILQLSQRGSVRIRDVAAAAGVKLPSVTRAVAKLESHGFVRHPAYGTVEITAEGVKAAQAVVRRDDCLTGLLVEVLAMDEDTAKFEVCRLEHAVGAEVLARLEVLLSHAASPSSRRWLKSLHAKLETRRRSGRKRPRDARVGSASLHARGPE